MKNIVQVASGNRIVTYFKRFDESSAECMDAFVKLMQYNWDVSYSDREDGYFPYKVSWVKTACFYVENDQRLRVWMRDDGLYARDDDALPQHIQRKVAHIEWEEALRTPGFKLC